MKTGPSRDWGVRLRRLSLLALILISVICPAAPAAAGQPEFSELMSPVPTRFEGYLKAIGLGKWLIGEYTVIVDDQTLLIEKRGRAEIGAWLVVWGELDDTGRVRALMIIVDRPAGRSGPTIQFSGVLTKQNGNYWVVEQIPILVTDTTLISGVPTIGALLWVVAEQQGDMLAATALEVIAEDPEAIPVEFEGPIRAFNDQFWVVGKHQVNIDSRTIRIGEPSLDKNAEVKALVEANGQLLALMIRVVDPAEEARVSAVVASIDAEPDGKQTWEVLAFPETPWAAPKISLLHIDANTLVDESRATAQTGQWVNVRGVDLGQDEYRADVIRLEKPVPVSVAGEFNAAPNSARGGSWWQIDGQPVWLASRQSENVVSAYTGGIVTVVGVRLPNGVIWAKRVEESAGRMR